MSELAPGPFPTIDDYQAFVSSTRFPETVNVAWQEDYSRRVEDELMELLVQHGAGMLLLLPEEAGVDHRDAPDDLRFHMADELGDSLWFCVDTADRLGERAAALGGYALQLHAPEAPVPLRTFTDVEEQAQEHASTITITNKRGLYGIDDPAFARASLRQNPGYLLMRTATRLSRSLCGGQRDLAPYSATELEPLAETRRALGEYLLVIAYVSATRLGIPLTNIAAFNMAKLTHRKAHGKAHDLQFGRSYLPPDAVADRTG